MKIGLLQNLRLGLSLGDSVTISDSLRALQLGLSLERSTIVTGVESASGAMDRKTLRHLPPKFKLRKQRRGPAGVCRDIIGITTF